MRETTRTVVNVNSHRSPKKKLFRNQVIWIPGKTVKALLESLNFTLFSSVTLIFIGARAV